MSDIGRPSVINIDTVAKLTEAFRLGFNDEDACLHAEIDRSTYYRHIQSDTTFATQMKSAKNYARLKCCSVLLEAIENKNVQVCQWWLERRYREQFGKPQDTLNQRIATQQVFDEIRQRYTIKPESTPLSESEKL